MKVAIIGSRNITDKSYIYKQLDSFFKDNKPELIVSGGAHGPDKIGIAWALENKINVKEFLPDWERYKKSAGFIRNTQIVEAADLVIAFWDGLSKGTKDSINKAKKLNKQIKIISQNNEI